MKKLYTLLSIIIFSSSSFVLGQVVNFQTLFGQEAEGAEQTADGGYVLGGSVNGGDGYIAKTDALGQVEWEKVYTPTETIDDIDIFSFVQTHDGGYLLAGEYLDWSVSSNFSFLLIKTDALGNVLWSKTYGLNAPGSEQRLDEVVRTRDGGFLLLGDHDTTGIINDMLVIKTDSMGVLQWGKTFDTNLAGFDLSEGLGALETIDSSLVFVGETRRDQGHAEQFIIKTNAMGDTLWTRVIGGDPINAVEIAIRAAETSNKDLMILGQTKTFGSGFEDLSITKLDSNGDLIWAKAYGGTQEDFPADIIPAGNNNFLVLGHTWSFGAGNLEADVYLTKIDSGGAIIWSKTYGRSGSDIGYTIRPTADGGYIIAGTDNQAYLVKIDSNGNTLCNQYTAATVVTPFTPTIVKGAIIGNYGWEDTVSIVTTAFTSIQRDLCPCDYQNEIFLDLGVTSSACSGEDVNLGGTPTAFGGTGPYSYLWTPGASLDNDTLSNVVGTPNDTTKYFLTVTDSLGCEKMDSVQINVVTVDTSLTVSGTTITANSVFGTFEWVDCNNNFAYINHFNASYTPTSNGNYAVEITENGCVDTSRCVNIIITGLMESDQEMHFEVFPNPTKGLLNIFVDQTSEYDYNVKVTNSLGQNIKEFRSLKSSITIDLSDKEAGVYFLTLEDAKHSKTLKIFRR